MKIKNLLEKYDIKITNEQILKLESYIEIMIRENKKYNVASIKELEPFLEKTLIDSLIVSRSEKIKLEGKLIDIGSGNGFPGIVLAIVYPKLKVTLLDAEKKKVRFLEIVKKELDLDLNIVHERSEEYSKKHKKSFDFVCAKALVSKPDKWLKWTEPFLKNRGFLINYKTEKFLEELELSSIKQYTNKWNLRVVEKIYYKVFQSERIIVIMKKG